MCLEDSDDGKLVLLSGEQYGKMEPKYPEGGHCQSVLRHKGDFNVLPVQVWGSQCWISFFLIFPVNFLLLGIFHSDCLCRVCFLIGNVIIIEIKTRGSMRIAYSHQESSYPKALNYII